MADRSSISSTSMRSLLEDAIDGTLTRRTAFMNHDVEKMDTMAWWMDKAGYGDWKHGGAVQIVERCGSR